MTPVERLALTHLLAVGEELHTYILRVHDEAADQDQDHSLGMDLYRLGRRLGAAMSDMRQARTLAALLIPDEPEAAP